MTGHFFLGLPWSLQPALMSVLFVPMGKCSWLSSQVLDSHSDPIGYQLCDLSLGFELIYQMGVTSGLPWRSREWGIAVHHSHACESLLQYTEIHTCHQFQTCKHWFGACVYLIHLLVTYCLPIYNNCSMCINKSYLPRKAVCFGKESVSHTEWQYNLSPKPRHLWDWGCY